MRAAAIRMVRFDEVEANEPPSRESAFSLDDAERWEHYERCKSVLVALNLDPLEYDRRVAALAEDLDL